MQPCPLYRFKLLAAAALLAPAAVFGAGQGAVHFDIPAQPLSGALTRFSLATGLQVLYEGDITEYLESPALQGDYTPEAALQKLLRASGLRYRFSNGKTVTLETAGAAPQSKAVGPNAPTAAMLPALHVTAQTGDAGDLFNEDIYRYSPHKTATATKTDTPLMETPQSVQVLKREIMDDQQNITVSEALRNVSGVIPLDTLFTPSMQGTLIRGFASEQVIDGFTQYYNPGDRESTINIDRIEVLKGTNGTLYSGGSGSPVGGLVSIVSKLPQALAFGELGFKIGNYDFYQPFADINQPLNDNALFRITGEYTHSESHIDTLETQRYNINPSLTLTDNENTTFTVQGKVSRWRQPDYQGLPATSTLAGNFGIRPETFIGNPDLPDSRAEFDGVWGTLDHRFNAIWSINLKARYAASSFDEKAQILFGGGSYYDDPLMPPSTWALVNTRLYQEQEELSFLGNATAKFDLGPTRNTVLIGGDHSEFKDKGFMDMDMMGAYFADLRDPSFPGAYAEPGPGQINSRVDNTTYGGYLQWQSTLFDRVHLLGGVRVGTVEIDYQRSGTANLTDKTEWLPRIGGVIDILDGLSVFASYAEGMRGQPYANFLGSPQPEMSRHREAGIKIDLASQLTGQMAVYEIERDNVAVRSMTDPLLSVPDGKQRSRGFEADLVWQPTEALSVLAAYAHTDARFMNNPGGTAVEVGNRMARVPENSGRLWANYRFRQDMLRGLSVGAGVYVQSDAYVSDDNRFKTPGFHSFDASAAYEIKQFKIATTVKNFTNEDAYLPYGYLGGHVAPVAGTSVFTTFSMKY
jgi:iron complex outermembrane receptor protein